MERATAEQLLAYAAECEARGDVAQAENVLTQAMDAYQTLRADPTSWLGRATTYEGLSRLTRERGDYALAKEYAENAAGTYEEMYARGMSEETLLHFLDWLAETATLEVAVGEAVVGQGTAARAADVGQRSRASLGDSDALLARIYTALHLVVMAACEGGRMLPTCLDLITTVCDGRKALALKEGPPGRCRLDAARSFFVRGQVQQYAGRMEAAAADFATAAAGAGEVFTATGSEHAHAFLLAAMQRLESMAETMPGLFDRHPVVVGRSGLGPDAPAMR